jgi:hypothetical protein
MDRQPVKQAIVQKFTIIFPSGLFVLFVTLQALLVHSLMNSEHIRAKRLSKTLIKVHESKASLIKKSNVKSSNGLHCFY